MNDDLVLRGVLDCRSRRRHRERSPCSRSAAGATRRWIAAIHVLRLTGGTIEDSLKFSSTSLESIAGQNLGIGHRRPLGLPRRRGELVLPDPPAQSGGGCQQCRADPPATGGTQRRLAVLAAGLRVSVSSTTVSVRRQPRTPPSRSSFPVPRRPRRPRVASATHSAPLSVMTGIVLHLPRRRLPRWLHRQCRAAVRSRNREPASGDGSVCSARSLRWRGRRCRHRPAAGRSWPRADQRTARPSSRQ